MQMDIYKTNLEGEPTDLVVADNRAIAIEGSIDQHPVAVFLARQSEKSRRIHLQGLNLIAGMLTGGLDDARTFNWAGIRYQHTQAVRSKLAGSLCSIDSQADDFRSLWSHHGRPGGSA
ncbi:MAG: hypothetical protein IPL01_19795 [Acidobacteria bacterium]|nr:hypothetical protein [Acidobacteriota bacterium]